LVHGTTVSDGPARGWSFSDASRWHVFGDGGFYQLLLELAVATIPIPKKLKALAAYDNLTNEKTYTHNQADITALFEHAQANHEPLTLMALDIDRLRKINQDFGHLAGNTVLIQTAETLLGVFRQT
jgi:GGDEF domain-containing protein